MSLREQLNNIGIDGHLCERLIGDYFSIVRAQPEVTMGEFINICKVQHT